MTTGDIGVLGSGDVGRTLGAGFADRGWNVMVGTRSPESLEDWLESTPGTVGVGSFAEAATHGEIVVLAVAGEAWADVVNRASTDAFSGKLVIDVTNPLDFSDDGPPRLLFGGTDSIGERLQGLLPHADVVKCFNTVSHRQMVDPEFEMGTPPMFICGDDPDAKARVRALVNDFGWPEIMDIGDIEGARYLEALVPLWVRVGSVIGTYEHAFEAVV